MKQSIRDKLEGLVGRLDELDRTLASAEATGAPGAKRRPPFFSSAMQISTATC